MDKSCDSHVIYPKNTAAIIQCTFSVAGILAALPRIADDGLQDGSRGPLVRKAKLLIVKQYSHSLQHAFIGELIGKVGRGVLRERERERD